MTAASDPDILAGVERWARVRRSAGDGQNVAHIVCDGHEWRVWTGTSIERMHVHVGLWRTGANRNCLGEWQVPPALALAWALLVESDAGPVDVGRCPDCDGRGRFWYDGEDCHPPGMVECPVCASGRKTISAARLLLDAASGDAKAREALLVEADRLAFAGDPIGELLGWALILWTGKPTAPIVLTFTAATQRDARRQFMAHLADDKREGWVLCMLGPSWQGPANRPPEEWTAAATSPERGHPHTAESLRWLEWLTWAREFARAREDVAGHVPTSAEVRDEALALSRSSTLSVADATRLVRQAAAAGATRSERAGLGVAGLETLVYAYEAGALHR